MALLQYEIGVTNADQLKRVLRGIEAEAKASAKRLEATSKRAAPARAARVKEDRSALLGIAAIGKVARQVDYKQHMERLAHQRKEQNQAIRGFVEIGRAARAEEMRRAKEAIRNAKREEAARGNAAKRASRGFARTVTGAAGRAGRTVMGLGSLTAGVAGVGLTAAGANAVNQRIGTITAATDLANQAAGNPGETRSREQIRADVLKQTAEINKKTGISEEDVITGLRGFTEVSGNLAGGQKMLPFLANLADATGGDVGTIGKTAAKVQQAVQLGGTKDPAEQMKKTQQIMAAIAQQTKVGSIEMADFAEHIGEITSAAGQFKGNAPDLIKFMSATAQMSIAGGASSSAEAATAVARVPTDIIKNAKDLQNMGVNIYADTGHTQVKDPMEIFMDILQKTGGNLDKVGKVFDERSRKVFEPLRKTFTEAERNKKGSGKEAVLAALKPFMEANMSPEEIQKGAEFRQSAPDRQLARAMGELNRALGDQLLPAVTKAVPEFTKLIPVLSKFAGEVADVAGWFAGHPFQGLGAVVLASVGKDLAAAGIGAAVRRMIESMMQGGGGGGGFGPGPGPGRPGKGPGFLPTAGAFVTAGLTGYALGSEMGQEASDKTANPMIHAETVRRDLEAGTLNRNQMFKEQESLTNELGDLYKGPSLADTVFGGISSLFGGKSAKENNTEAITEVQAALGDISTQLAQTKDLGLNEVAGGFAQLETRLTAVNAKLAELEQLKIPETPNGRRNNPVIAR